MRVEITEKRLSSQDPDTGRLYVQEQGDIITVPDKLGKRWCGYGWCKDVDGKVKTGERVVRGVSVQPRGSKHAAKAEEA